MHHHQFSQKTEEASNQRESPPSMDIPIDKQQSLTPSTHFQTLNPIWRLSPWHNGSTLYDSYELRAVTQQLNRAIQGSNGSSSPHACYLTSPFYRQRLDLIYKENATAPKRILCSRSDCAALDRMASRRGTRGFVMRLWKKVKRGFVRSRSKE